MAKPNLLPLIQSWDRQRHFDLIYPLSALTGENVGGLPSPRWLASCRKGHPLFPKEEPPRTRRSETLTAELIREQVFLQTSAEVPYSVAVEIENFDEARREAPRPLVRIEASLIVERQSQKGILIGKGGRRLKAIGTEARRAIERTLGCQIFLGLTVRVREGWTEAEGAVRRHAGEGTNVDRTPAQVPPKTRGQHEAWWWPFSGAPTWGSRRSSTVWWGARERWWKTGPG